MDTDVTRVANRVRTAYSELDLRLLKPAVVNSAGIEAVDAEFLCAVGVPRIEQLNISFNLADNLPSLRQVIYEKGLQVPNAFRDMRCLNEKYNNIVGVDTANGAVHWLDLTGRLPECFVNSRIRYLVGFMAECVLHWKRWTQHGVPQRESYRIARELMSRLDPGAVEEPFWAEVFEEMEQAMV